MKIKGVMARFMPLCDVSVCILGLMFILITLANFEPPTEPSSIVNNIDSIYYKIDDKGKCRYMTSDNNWDEKEIDIESEKDIQDFVDKNSQKIKLFFFISYKYESDFHWQESEKKLRKAWKIDGEKRILVRIPNFPNPDAPDSKK